MNTIESLKALADNPYNDRAYTEVYQALEDHERLKDACRRHLTAGSTSEHCRTLDEIAKLSKENEDNDG